MDFRFDEAAHIYTLDGVELDSVSRIIAPLVDYAGIPRSVLDFAAGRGKAVHAATHLIDRGSLNWDSVDPRIGGYLRAWQAFTEDVEPVWERSEEPMYHPELLYAGTPDRWGKISRKRVGLDIKTTAKVMPTTQVQLSGYDLLLQGNGMAPAEQLWGVWLAADGTYDLRIYPPDPVTFRACLNLRRAQRVIDKWKAKHE